MTAERLALHGLKMNFSIVITILAASASASSLFHRIGFKEKITQNDKHRSGLHVPYSPRIVSVVSTAAVKPGATLQLECDVVAAPEARLSWLHNGRPLVIGGSADLGQSSIGTVESYLNAKLLTHQLANSKSLLAVPCFGEQDAGVYACVAENDFGKTSANVSVNYEESNSLGSISCLEDLKHRPESVVDPSIMVWTSARIERVGASVQLQCRSNGAHGVAGVSWSEQDDNDHWHKIVSGDDLTVLANGDLLVKPSANCTRGCNFACSLDSRRMELFFYATALDNEK